MTWRAIPGQPFRPSARTHNLTTEAIDATQRKLGAPGRRDAKDNDVIHVRNDYAFALMRHQPAGVDILIPEQQLSADQYDPLRAEQYRAQHIYSITKPMERHVTRWCVLMQTLQPGEIGKAIMMSVTPARIELPGGFSGAEDGRDGSPNPFHEQFQNSRGVIPEGDYRAKEVQTTAIDRLLDQQWFAAQPALSPRDHSNVLWPDPSNKPEIEKRATLLDVQNATGEDFACTGSSNFRCLDGQWRIIESTCSDGCSSVALPERTAAGVSYLPPYPCTEMATAYDVQCVPETRHYGEVLLGPEPSGAWTSDAQTCSHNRICVRECQETSPGSGTWQWNLTTDCDSLPRNPTVECECPSLDTDIYTCSETSEPRHVIFGCREVPTTTTTGDPSTTSTTLPPCSGDCYATCEYTGGRYQWVTTDTCTGTNCNCIVNPLTGCTLQHCNNVTNGTCARIPPSLSTTSTTSTTLPGTTTTTEEPPPTCTDTCDWECQGNEIVGFQWSITRSCPNWQTAPCCELCEAPTGRCCDDGDVGNTETKNCGATSVQSQAPCVSTTTTTSTSTTTTTTTTTEAPTTTTTTAEPSSTTTTTTTTTSEEPSSTTTTTTTAEPSCIGSSCTHQCQETSPGVYGWVETVACATPCTCPAPGTACNSGNVNDSENTSCEAGD